MPRYAMERVSRIGDMMSILKIGGGDCDERA